MFYFFILDRNVGYLQDTVLQQCCTTDCSCLDMPFSPSSRYCFDTKTLSSAHSFCGSLQNGWPATVFPAWNHGKAPLSTQTKTTALSGPTAAKMHLRPNDCGCLWVPHGKSRKHPTIHRSFISCPVILFLLYLFCCAMSATFL